MQLIKISGYVNQGRPEILYNSFLEQIRIGKLLVSHIADRVAVMHRGRLVKMRMTHKVIANPLHPYTQKLIAAVPVADGQTKAGDFDEQNFSAPVLVTGRQFYNSNVHQSLPIEAEYLRILAILIKNY